MDWHIVIVLLISGTAVGIINTLAGGGSIITMTMFMAFGLQINVANGTNRIAVLMQNLAATVSFIRKKSFNINHGLLLSIPVILGKAETVQPIASDAKKLLIEKNKAESIRQEIDLCAEVYAPVCAGDKLGTVTVYQDDEIIYSYDLIAADDVPKLSFFNIFFKCLSLIYKKSL